MSFQNSPAGEYLESIFKIPASAGMTEHIYPDTSIGKFFRLTYFIIFIYPELITI